MLWFYLGHFTTWMHCHVFCVVWRAAGQIGEGRQSEGKSDSAAPSSRSWLVLQVFLTHCVSPFGFSFFFFSCCHYFASLLCGSSSQSNKDRNAPSSRLLDSPTSVIVTVERERKKISLKKNHFIAALPPACSLLSSAQCDGLSPPSTKLSDSRFMLSVSILPLNSI